MHLVEDGGGEAYLPEEIDGVADVTCPDDAGVRDDEHARAAELAREFANARKRAVSEDKARSWGMVEGHERIH
jgi:hypothetical protein